MPRLVAFLAPLALAGLSACQQTPQERPPLEGAAIGGSFALTDQTGMTVRWSDFAGKYRIVYFGYTYCPDVCPTDVQRMSQGLAKFSEAEPELGGKIQPIFITLDPERDTPAVVGEFVGAFSDRIVALTGTPEQMQQAAKAFVVFSEKGEKTEGGGYLVDHTNITYLFDPEGNPLATLPTDEGADAVAKELAKWVR